MVLSAGDYFGLLKEAINLIREQQIEAAQSRLQAALLGSASRTCSERRNAVAEVNRLLLEAKAQKAAIVQAIDSLPDSDREYARLKIPVMADAIIADLRSRKRTLSRPR